MMSGQDHSGLYRKFQAGWAHNKELNVRSMSKQNKAQIGMWAQVPLTLFPPDIFSGVHLGGPCLLVE